MSNTGVQWTRNRGIHHEAHHPIQGAKVVFATAATAGIWPGRRRRRLRRISRSAASAGPASYSTEAFRETIRPWDSITIPALSCPTGYLENQDYSPGRIVPKGVEILEPDAIGVTISEVKSTLVTDWWNTPHYPVTGTTPHGGHSTATNWDPFASKELIIRLHCTTDLDKAFMDPSPYR